MKRSTYRPYLPIGRGPSGRTQQQRNNNTMNTDTLPQAAITIPTPEKVPIMDAAPHAERGPIDSIFPALVEEELAKDRQHHAPINSIHEGYTFLLEGLAQVWEQQNNPDEELSRLVQMAAMARRIAEDQLPHLVMVDKSNDTSPTGVQLIAAERQRQRRKGYTVEHDCKYHTADELISAAGIVLGITDPKESTPDWALHARGKYAGGDPATVRKRLAISGALLAAAFDQMVE